MKELIIQYVAAHGYVILYLAYVAELLALPLPGETIMTFVGYLSYQGKVNYWGSFSIIYLGVCSGITTSWWIGEKLGNPFFHKYGHYIRLSPERFDRAAEWFDKYGYKILVVAYFIPGIRHITGYTAGIMNTPFRLFAVPAYLGAFLYVSIFVTLGRLIGPSWDKYHLLIHEYTFVAGILATLVLTVYLIYKSHKLIRNK